MSDKKPTIGKPAVYSGMRKDEVKSFKGAVYGIMGKLEEIHLINGEGGFGSEFKFEVEEYEKTQRGWEATDVVRVEYEGDNLEDLADFLVEQELEIAKKGRKYRIVMYDCKIETGGKITSWLTIYEDDDGG